MPLPQINERIKEVPAQALRAVFAGIGQVLLVADKIRSRAAEQVAGAAAVTAPPREAPATEPAAQPAPEPAAGPTAKPTPEPAEPGSARWRALDKTGNVRLIAQSDEAAAPSSPQTPDVAAPAAKAPPADEAPADAAPADDAPADDAPADVALADEALAEVAALEVAPAPADEGLAPSLPEATDVQPAPAAAPAPPDARAAAEPGGLPLSNYDALTIASLRARLRVLSAAQVTTLLEYERVTQGRPAVITMFERRLAKLAQEDS
jgi:hypothetical protein